MTNYDKLNELFSNKAFVDSISDLNEMKAIYAAVAAELPGVTEKGDRMKTSFLYNGHEIAFFRGLVCARMLIDGVECDRQEGFVQCQMSSFELHGELESGEKVCLKIKLGFVSDTAMLNIDDQLIESKKAL